jgi:hypothetical protein
VNVPAKPGIWPFLAWGALGAGVVLAALTALSIGIFVLPLVIAALIVLLRWRGSRNITAVGLLTGAGLVPLYVSYLNRGGPGTVCSSTASGQACIDEWSPWPWLVAGVVLVLAGAVLFLWLRHRASSASRESALAG